MNTRLLFAMFLALITVFDAACAGAKMNIEEGRWEITSQVKMQGMTMPPMTFAQCITKQNAVPQGNSSGQDNCKVSDMKTVGDTVSWTVVCKEPSGEMKGSGKITYHGDRFEGEVNMDMAGMTMVTVMSGKRIGPCE